MSFISLIKTGIDELVKSDGFKEKIDWWMKYPHAAERWLNFELGFEIDKKSNGDHFVRCEYYDRNDIVIVNDLVAEDEKDDNKIEFIIELKWWGNWADSEFDKLKNDKTKIEKYNTPSASIMVMLWVQPKNENKHYEWIQKSQKILDESELNKGFQEYFNQLPDLQYNHDCFSTNNLSEVQVLSYWYLNGPAKQSKI